MSFRLDDREKAAYEADGFLLRRGTFTVEEVAAIAADCEALVADLVHDRQARRYEVGSYVFDPDAVNLTFIKWEGDTDHVHGIEPLCHLSKPLSERALDRRFLDPSIDLVDDPAPVLFTEKLNLKRPHVGGANPLHQDEPYWAADVGDIDHMVTAMLLLDDATLENGCLHVVPGSHTSGRWATRTDGDTFAANEIDQSQYPDVEAVPVEMAAGDVVWFGPWLVHRSSPNTSDRPRRALLFSYQRPGHPVQLDLLRRFFGQPASA